jgi:hypothetical protein
MDMFSVMDADSRRATFSAMAILSILFLLCCISKWILWGFTAIFTLFAIYLTYRQFIAPKFSKSKGKVVKLEG